MTPSATPVVALRTLDPRDGEFIDRVYAHTRYQELAPLGWPPEQVEAFLLMQSHAQRRHYRAVHPDAPFRVVECDGVPAGRLSVDRRPDEIRIVDIALLPEFRGRGVGTRLLTGLLGEAEASGRPVRIHVEANNPARTLYRRLGFVQTETTGVYVLMEWWQTPSC